MPDPHLFELIQGMRNKKSNSAKESDSTIIEEAVKIEVDRRMGLEDSTNQLLPEAVRRAKIELEVWESMNYSEFSKDLASALNILRDESISYLDKNDNEILQQTLDNFCEKIESLNLKDLTNEKLRNALTISAESQNLILKIAIAKYNQSLIDDSLVIFSFLSLVEEEEADYWYRLGLVAQKAHRYDLALKAFETTSHLSPELAEVHLYSAECYFKKGMNENAQSELKIAKKMIDETKNMDDLREHLLEVEHLLMDKGSKARY